VGEGGEWVMNGGIRNWGGWWVGKGG
jgi:hypothetical protein